MKNWITLILGVMVIVNAAFSAPQLVDKVAAIVNDSIILESEIEHILHLVRIQSRYAGQQLPDEKILRQEVLEKQIMDNIILQMGERAGLQISNQQLDQAITMIAMNNHINIEQLRSSLAYSGINYREYRMQIRKEILIARVRDDAVRRRFNILPHEVNMLARQIGEENNQDTELNVRQIFLPLPENVSQQQIEDQAILAKQLITDLKRGMDFDKLVVIHSLSPISIRNSNMGWEKLEDFPTIFIDALSTAKKGDIIGPIYSRFGLYILKVNDLKVASKKFAKTEWRARHIMLKLSPVIPRAQAKIKLENIASDIRSRKITFVAAAKKFSEDPQSAQYGGDLGWFSPQDLDPVFYETLLHLQKGQVSQIFYSSIGCHIIQLLDVRQIDQRDEEQRENAYRMLFNRKFNEESQSWMQEQLSESYIKILSHNDQ
ncbi:peptidylprolyl isomerase SurA [Pantoea sp. Nvir]|nr:peptidylprolyl isomerase SurA [Pantoea sp. Nvir]